MSHSRSLLPLLLSTCLTAGAAQAAFVPGTNARGLTHDSQPRVYNVYAPPGYAPAQSVPLVVDIHGYTSTKEQQQSLSGWQAKADAVGFLVAYPDGLGGSWNAGVCCGTSVTNNVDDVGFIRAMLSAIAAEASIDSARIYVTGLSNGGAMSHRLACEAADVFAAAAPLSFPTPYTDFATQCQPSRAIPVLTSMGLTDVLVPYAGGAFESAAASFANWRSKNSCGAEPIEEQVGFGGSDCALDTSCAGGTQVGLCSIRGSAFAPPLDPYSGHILYINDDGVVMADVLWRFFETGSLLPGPGVPLLGPGAALALGAGLAALGGVGARRRRGRRPLS
jgi:polyhydroxybutyrate depolymerase